MLYTNTYVQQWLNTLLHKGIKDVAVTEVPFFLTNDWG